MRDKFSRKKKHWLIVISWIIAAVICTIYLPYAGKPFKIGEVRDPKAESTLASNIMEKELPFGGSRLFVLYKSDKLNANHAPFTTQVKKSLDGLKKLSFEHRVISPYQNARQISASEREAYAVVETNSTAEELASSMNDIRNALGQPKNIEMFIGGEPSYIADVYRLSEINLIRGELIALPICFVVLIFVFGGIVAAFIPIISGIICIIIISTILYILGHQIDLTVFVLNIATMLGLGLSLDYTLLITYRFREEHAKWHDCKKTIEITLATAGKSIFFSGLIVLISIASLIFFPINMLYSIGIAGVVVVAITVLCSLTFLPALLCILEKNVTSTIPQLKHFTTEDVHNHRWYRFVMVVMRFPFLFLIPTIGILLLLGYPFLDVKLNSSDAKILPTWVESRQLLDQFEQNFNANELTPTLILFKSQNKSIISKNNISHLYDYAQHLKKDPRVKRVGSIVTIKSGLTKQQYQQLYASSPLPFDEYQKQFFKGSTKGKYTIMSVVSKFSKDDVRNFDLVDTVRHNKIGGHITKQVAGTSATIIDTLHIVYNLFIKVVIVISIVTYLALVWLLRSLILPLKAILMNFLSLSVCYGMLVFIFQEGHFANIINFTPVGFTDMNLPILLFFALFGLSMDYEVFLLSRIKEYYEQTKDNTKSVALGLEKSARIITSAALIVVIVSGAFVTADIVFIKAFGLGTALAVAIDATLIRLLLVPTTMRLLGDWNWYIPQWLDRILPNINFDKEVTSYKKPNSKE
ncbi:MAG: MMPL family transporter [Gammaproteobacteria bacterium]|nr:MMPL family transporter [Gammaproteobacteria bacterium]